MLGGLLTTSIFNADDSFVLFKDLNNWPQGFRKINLSDGIYVVEVNQQDMRIKPLVDPNFAIPPNQNIALITSDSKIGSKYLSFPGRQNLYIDQFQNIKIVPTETIILPIGITGQQNFIDVSVEFFKDDMLDDIVIYSEDGFKILLKLTTDEVDIYARIRF